MRQRSLLTGAAVLAGYAIAVELAFLIVSLSWTLPAFIAVALLCPVIGPGLGLGALWTARNLLGTDGAVAPDTGEWLAPAALVLAAVVLPVIAFPAASVP